MGCNSSQVHVDSPGQFAPYAQQELQSQIVLIDNRGEAESEDVRSPRIKPQSKQKIEKLDFKQWCFLFGQTQTERKIVCFDTKQYQFSTISSRTKIPQPILKCLPIEVIYQESQQLFSSALFNNNSHPPYNFMLALWLDSKKIFLCGGITIDFKHVSKESFVFDTSLQNAGNHRLGNNLMGNKLDKLQFMSTKRYSHMGVVYTIGLLKYVYVFGGRGQKNQLLHECQRYSVVQKKWTKIAPMKVGRSTGFAFVYRQRIYVCGGYSQKPKRTKKIEVYHPDKDYWQVLNVKMHRGLQTGLLFSVNPNQLLFIGGNLEYGSVNSMVKVNLEQETYIAAGQMKYPRVLEKGCITNKQIIVFGGSLHDGLEIYNYKQNQWKQNPCSFNAHITTQQINSFSYSIETVQVQYEETLIETKINSNVSDSRAIIFSHDSYPFILDVNFSHSLINKRAVPMSLRLRSYMGCILVKPGKYFISGGVSQFYQKSTRSCYLYYSGSNKCIQQSKMITARYKFSLCIYQQYVYVFGGRKSQEQQCLWQCQKYNVQTNTWSQVVALNIGRHSAIVFAIKNKIYIVGGSNSIRQLEEIEVYNPQNNTMILLETYIKLIPLIMHAKTEEEIYIFGKRQQSIYKLIISKSSRQMKIDFQKIESVEGEITQEHPEEFLILKKEQDQNRNLLEPKVKEIEYQQQQPLQKQQKEAEEVQIGEQIEETLQKIQDQKLEVEDVKKQQEKKFQQPIRSVEQKTSQQIQDINIKPTQQIQLIPQSSELLGEQQQLILQPVSQLPPEIAFSISFQSSIYFFSYTNKVYSWDGKQISEKVFVNQPLLGEVDWGRVSIS